MIRYFFELAYKGTQYNGWQIQTNTENTIQQVVEECLAVILGGHYPTVACGRTDKGVHARSFYFHLDVTDELDDHLAIRMNAMLPDDIAVKRIFVPPDHYHARFSALSRQYVYYFHNEPDVFLNGLSCLLRQKPNLDLIHEAGMIVTLQEEFRHFCKSPDRHRSTLCSIQNVRVVHLDNNRFCIDITANRFLKSMMRILASRMVKVGQGLLDIHAFESIFSAGSGEQTYDMLPPDGLYLEALVYPFSEA